MRSTLALLLATLAAVSMATPINEVANGRPGRGPGGGSGGGGGGGNCSASGSGVQACCNGDVLSGCLVQVLGSQCTTSAYCCNGGGTVGGLIDVDLANCVALS